MAQYRLEVALACMERQPVRRSNHVAVSVSCALGRRLPPQGTGAGLGLGSKPI